MLLTDLRYAFRSVWRRPGSSAAIVATLTLAITANTTLFSLINANYFSELGVAPALGRGFLPREGTERGAHAVVVISQRFWQRRFAADPSVVGRVDAERQALFGHRRRARGIPGALVQGHLRGCLGPGLHDGSGADRPARQPGGAMESRGGRYSRPWRDSGTRRPCDRDRTREPRRQRFQDFARTGP